MTYGELLGIVLLIIVMMVGFNYMDKAQNDCKISAINSHLSVEDAKKLCER